MLGIGASEVGPPSDAVQAQTITKQTETVCVAEGFHLRNERTFCALVHKREKVIDWALLERNYFSASGKTERFVI